MTTVCFFIDQQNHNPVGDFLDQNKDIKSKASGIVHNIQEFGLSSVIPHLKKLSGLPLWEIRILGKNSARIIYAHQFRDQIILLHAFKKKSNKTPVKEINIALKRLHQ